MINDRKSFDKEFSGKELEVKLEKAMEALSIQR